MKYDARLCWGLVVLPQLDDCTKAVGKTLNQSGPAIPFTPALSEKSISETLSTKEMPPSCGA